MIYSFLSDIFCEEKWNFIRHQLCLCSLLQSMGFELEGGFVKTFTTVYLNMEGTHLTSHFRFKTRNVIYMQVRPLSFAKFWNVLFPFYCKHCSVPISLNKHIISTNKCVGIKRSGIVSFVISESVSALLWLCLVTYTEHFIQWEILGLILMEDSG